jgi:peptide/nickel transport system ATP-binding protein/oligopeptide transport system ATP-binding protein
MTTPHAPTSDRGPLLEVDRLKTHFFTDDGVVRAVDGISFGLEPRQTIGIVGESGCGKSVTSLSIMRLYPSPPGRVVDGRIMFKGRDLVRISREEIRKIRGDEISMIFQEPMTSLNPIFRVGRQLSETVMLHQGLSKKAALDKSVEMLDLVGIPSAKNRLRDYPHQLSGGMRQRVMIAMALSCNPDLLIADEPTTALDVTIQAQILDLMNRLKDEVGTAIIFITHDLGVIAEMAREVAVMYAGVVVEKAGVEDLFAHPRHPYTQGLLGSLPRPDRDAGAKTKLAAIPGIVPSLLDLPRGCRFMDRCRQAMEVCGRQEPELVDQEDGHYVRCWLYGRD